MSQTPRLVWPPPAGAPAGDRPTHLVETTVRAVAAGAIVLAALGALVAFRAFGAEPRPSRGRPGLVPGVLDALPGAT